MMSTHRLAIAGILALGITSSFVSGQCTVATFTPYGSACGNGFPGASLSGIFDTATCSGSVSLSAFPGCCNSFHTENIWVLGFNQVQIPVPGIPQPCFLLASPDLVFTTPAALTGIAFVAPASLSGLTVYLQAAAVYFTTIGFTTEVSLTNGLQVDFL